MPKKNEKTERIEPTKTYQITASNGEILTLENLTYSEMETQTALWLMSLGLAYPIGLKPDGIKEVTP